MSDPKEIGTALHEAARRRVGVPFDHLGRGPDVLDCIGLAVESGRECGWEVIDSKGYRRFPKDKLLEAGLEANFGAPVAVQPLRIEDLRPDDLVAMHGDDARVKRRLRAKRPVNHVGIVGIHEGRLTLIHTDAYIGRVVEQSIDATVLARIAAVYRRAV